MRLFFGLEIPVSVRNRVAHVQGALREHGVFAGNWTRPDLFHITVAFLGQYEADKLDPLEAMATSAARQVEPFNLTLGTIGTFARNRILWLGLRNDEGFRALSSLYGATVLALATDPVMTAEERPYRPHVTLARKLDMETFKTVGATQLEGTDWARLSFAVTHLTLFESTRVNGELMYPVRARFPLYTSR